MIGLSLRLPWLPIPGVRLHPVRDPRQVRRPQSHIPFQDYIFRVVSWDFGSPETGPPIRRSLHPSGPWLEIACRHENYRSTRRIARKIIRQWDRIRL